MLTGLGWLALEVKYLDRARSFYESSLDLDPVSESETEVRLAAGDAELVLRRPTAVPRGGLHTHYAFSTAAGTYDEWWDRLSESFDLVEHEFGGARSLYFYDVDGNCVEIGERGDDGDGITGIFEIVLEVTDLERAESFYRALGLDVMGRGDDRRRVRLTAGPFDVELWEPQLGLADGRGGVHVDVGFETDDPSAIVDGITADARAVEDLESGYRVVDPDGHSLTFR